MIILYFFVPFIFGMTMDFSNKQNAKKSILQFVLFIAYGYLTHWYLNGQI